MNNKQRWSDLTTDEQACYGNGCGAGPIFSMAPELLFNADCRQHDFYYGRGGDIIDKMEADILFYGHMLKSINSAKDRLYKKIPLFLMATLYFLAVFTFGAFAWTWKMYKK